MDSSPLEIVIVRKIVEKINALPRCRAEKLHGGPMSGAQKLDLMCCVEGRFLYLEVKRPGGKPTARQESTMRLWRATGARVECVTSADEALDIVRQLRDTGDAG